MSRRAAAALTAVVLLLCAVGFGVPALLVPGLAIAFSVAVSAAYVAIAGRRVALVRSPTSLTAIEGERVVLAVRAVGRGRRLRGGEIAPQPGAPFEPRRWLDRDLLRFTVAVGRRGSHEVGPSLLRVRDPFGLCESRTQSNSTHVVALPRTERVSRAAVRLLQNGPVAAGRRHAGALGDIDGVRAGEPGVAASRVHWPTVARTGSLAERVVTPEFDRGPLIVLDTRTSSDVESLDAAVRAAASLVLALARDGGARLLVCDEAAAWSIEQRLASWPRVHARLATLGQGRTLAWRTIETASLVIWVTPSRLAGRPPGARRAPDFTVAPDGGAGGLFAVCGCIVRGSRAAEAA